MNIWLKNIIGYIISAIVVSAGTSYVGFTYPFVFLFNLYVFAGFLLYILLDLPPLKNPESTGGRLALLLGTFFLGGVIYTVVGFALPQFDPQFEIAKINRPPFVRVEPGPKLIAAGKEVFMVNKCINCHKASGEGSSDRGPDFDLWQIGLQTPEYLKEHIVDPKKKQALGFEDKKSKKAMPTYFGEEISEAEMDALVAYLGTLWNDQKMPVRGRADNLVPWDEDPEMIALGQKVYEGEVYEDLNCSVCHGKDGVVLMDGARDLRNPLSKSRNHDKPMKDWTDADWYKSVAHGIEETPMMPWIDDYPAKAIWLALTYDSQFHKKPENKKLPAPPPLQSIEDLWG